MNIAEKKVSKPNPRKKISLIENTIIIIIKTIPGGIQLSLDAK